jgi:hypothetical protein
MRAARRLAINGALVLLATGVAVAGAEVGLRLFFPQDLGIWYADAGGLMLHWPGRSTYLSRFGQWAHINSAGMRDREHSVEKRPGVYRILVLGDSFMEALQVPFEASFPSRLEAELAGRWGRPVEVVNASVSGWGTDAQLEYLARYGLTLRPDLILVGMTLHNDISDNLREEFHRLVDGVLVARGGARPSLWQRATLDAKAFLASRSQLYQLGLKYWRSGRVRQEAGSLSNHVAELFRTATTARTSRGWEVTHRLLEEVVQRGHEMGAEVAVVLIPLAIQMSDEAFDVFLRQQGLPAGEVSKDRPQAIMRAWGDRQHLAVIDLLPEFRQWSAQPRRILYLEADGHWSEDGHRLAAGAVAREIERLGVLESGGRAHGTLATSRTGPPRTQPARRPASPVGAQARTP